MGAKEAVEFLIDDHGDIGKGFRDDFAKDKPYKSLLQRTDKDLEEVLEKFDWKTESDKWSDEITKDGRDYEKLVRYRRGTCFCACGWRELQEDFGREDVSCLRDIRTPLVTSRTPLMAAKDDFDEKK